ncbi:M23 family metallopeptidase [Cryobacterium sp. PH29-G1]|uniref:M23 family metallopeptidase n=1 Tax=Cryobacterium sp. PH29-G1 TaxID=3046211 RepID=UPI0024B9D81A|nr:M23 family metallopeptidase [Cryobacterium sp. PH29-G1]MDJ0349603.1 M23 family metallopeptidase [Cryobacterium sp. PH29-G1]
MVLTALLTVSISLPAHAVDVAASPTIEPAAPSTPLASQSLPVGTTAKTIVRDGYASQAAPPKPAAPAAAASLSAGPAIRWPFDGSVPIAGGYGPRVPPCAGCSGFHKGLDMNPGAGTPVHAIAAGVIRFATPHGNTGLGVHVIIDHPINGRLVSSLYGHMQLGSLAVREGQTVSVGQIIGRVGSTGQSTGAHLHFEILLDGVTPTNPYAWVSARAGRP